ncbi:hypothetical protein GE21DRAFT_1271496 [Neurospora crassa]|nr:hypothetical protein GE21DRAFT_1271496 [Neurospora crassa]
MSVETQSRGRKGGLSVVLSPAVFRLVVGVLGTRIAVEDNPVLFVPYGVRHFTMGSVQHLFVLLGQAGHEVPIDAIGKIERVCSCDLVPALPVRAGQSGCCIIHGLVPHTGIARSIRQFHLPDSFRLKGNRMELNQLQYEWTTCGINDCNRAAKARGRTS